MKLDVNHWKNYSTVLYFFFYSTSVCVCEFALFLEIWVWGTFKIQQNLIHKCMAKTHGQECASYYSLHSSSSMTLLP